MSVYVDSPIWPLGRMRMCHMIADTRAELLEMAHRIGLVAPLQRPGTAREHFDVCKSKRALAIRRGAIPVRSRELVAILRRKRARVEAPA